MANKLERKKNGTRKEGVRERASKRVFGASFSVDIVHIKESKQSFIHRQFYKLYKEKFRHSLSLCVALLPSEKCAVVADFTIFFSMRQQ